MNLNLTPKQFTFLVDTMLEYDQIYSDSEKTTQKAFVYLCDKMLKSEDKEIKIDFSRVLMYHGAVRIMEVTTKSMDELIKRVMG